MINDKITQRRIVGISYRGNLYNGVWPDYEAPYNKQISSILDDDTIHEE